MLALILSLHLLIEGEQTAAPALLLGTTVPARTVIVIAALYIAYHSFENHVIAPRVTAID